MKKYPLMSNQNQLNRAITRSNNRIKKHMGKKKFDNFKNVVKRIGRGHDSLDVMQSNRARVHGGIVGAALRNKASIDRKDPDLYVLGGAAGTSGLDLDLYSMFKSQVKAVSASLTDDIINGYIGGYLDAYPGETLDTIITTQGVQQQWLKQPSLSNNRQNYERTGKALSFRGGWSQISYEFGGRVFEWIMSPMCLSKTLYGMKFGGNNIQRYGPPRIGGSEGKMGPELEFLASLGGHSGVFMVSHSSTGRPQTLLEAPFWYYDLICPTDPRGLKFTGLTEATLI